MTYITFYFDFDDLLSATVGEETDGTEMESGSQFRVTPQLIVQVR